MQVILSGISETESKPQSPFYGEVKKPAEEGASMSLLALSHTKTEQHIYELMLTETRSVLSKVGIFSIRHLMVKSGLNNYSSIRRARTGLLKKLSIEQHKLAGGDSTSQVVYVIYSPEEIFERRRQSGSLPYPREIFDGEANADLSGKVIKKLVEKHNLSRRESQVALCCTKGLTNAEIGRKLFIHEETVKFHLRNIFIKFNVKRRTELLALLLGQN